MPLRMRLFGLEIHGAALIEGLIVIWIGEILDWEIRRLPGKIAHVKIWAAGILLEGILEIESFR